MPNPQKTAVEVTPEVLRDALIQAQTAKDLNTVFGLIIFGLLALAMAYC